MLERVKQRITGTGRHLGERYPFLVTVWAVQKRFGELNGSYLASAITLSSFLSLFPLLLVAISVIGFFSSGDPTLARDTVRFLGLSGSSEAATIVTDAIQTAEESKAAASIVGVVGLLWSGLGLVAALQYVYDTVWQVTGRGMKDKLFGLLWLVGGGLLFATSFAVTSLVGALPGFLAPINILVGIALSFGLFMWTAKVLPHRDIGFKALVPGAMVGAIGLEILKLVGSLYVPRAVASSSAVYGSIGVVFAILAWLLFFGRLVVYSAVVNVVRWEEEHGTVVIDIRVPNLPGEQNDDDATRAGQQDPEGDVVKT
ncbi:MAG TPA: YihY/virulence factor BrkB family protein [Acidimicrobiales bacterium]|nr:YihY/virulence factor BrkB family protein [Acidimicrobiales bacterium]